MRTAGFVLVGGRSSRMGTDKALLPWNSHTLVEHVASRVSDAAGNVALVGPPGSYSHLLLNTFADLRPGLGPLAGIEAALATHRGDLNLIVACDMPGLDVYLLKALLAAAAANDALCTALRDASHSLQPLCAVYRPACLPLLRSALDRRHLKLFDFLSTIHAQPFDTAAELANLNCPADWQSFHSAADAYRP